VARDLPRMLVLRTCFHLPREGESHQQAGLGQTVLEEVDLRGVGTALNLLLQPHPFQILSRHNQMIQR